mgnify:CR=1 FL=1
MCGYFKGVIVVEEFRETLMLAHESFYLFMSFGSGVWLGDEEIEMFSRINSNTI